MGTHESLTQVTIGYGVCKNPVLLRMHLHNENWYLCRLGLSPSLEKLDFKMFHLGATVASLRIPWLYPPLTVLGFGSRTRTSSRESRLGRVLMGDALRED